MSITWKIKKLLTIRNHLFANRTPEFDRLHLGCGTRKLKQYVNVDIQDSDCNLDLSRGSLPWKNNSFKIVITQHLIEHLHWPTEGIPLLSEIYRVLEPGGYAWISCPDMKRVCEEYLKDGGISLLNNIQSRFPNFELPDEAPSSDIVNHLFHQYGEHRNLFDYTLLRHCCKSAGFSQISQGNETMFLGETKGVPTRDDDFVTLYVRAQKNN